MTYFSIYEKIEEVPEMSLFYDFKQALESEDYELCQKIKNEFDRRDGLGQIDKDFMKALLTFYNQYSIEDSGQNKEYFNQAFSQYIK